MALVNSPHKVADNDKRLAKFRASSSVCLDLAKRVSFRWQNKEFKLANKEFNVSKWQLMRYHKSVAKGVMMSCWWNGKTLQYTTCNDKQRFYLVEAWTSCQFEIFSLSAQREPTLLLITPKTKLSIGQFERVWEQLAVSQNSWWRQGVKYVPRDLCFAFVADLVGGQGKERKRECPQMCEDAAANV